MEVWKSLNINEYPVKLQTQAKSDNTRTLRESTLRQFDESCKTKVAENSFHISAAKLGNQTPSQVKIAKSTHAAKRAIKQFCADLPI